MDLQDRRQGGGKHLGGERGQDLLPAAVVGLHEQRDGLMRVGRGPAGAARLFTRIRSGLLLAIDACTRPSSGPNSIDVTVVSR